MAALRSLPGVRSVRGLGLLVAAELDRAEAKEVASAALSAGLVVNPVTESALRLAPSLLVTEEEIDKAMVLLATAISEVADSGSGPDPGEMG